tara:strand:- start:2172 stop:2657 length:486 start_codon:yes stop_codon:yes gene_type:complete
MRLNYKFVTLILACCLLFNNNKVFSDITLDDLLEFRDVNQYEWLSLKLDLLALKMSFPAYRIDLSVTPEQQIQFTFNFSGAMAKHFTETLEKSEAQKAMSYHAQGLSDAVDTLILNEFQKLAVKFDPAIDFYGRFLGPGHGNDIKPREIGRWEENHFEWVR